MPEASEIIVDIDAHDGTLVRRLRISESGVNMSTPAYFAPSDHTVATGIPMRAGTLALIVRKLKNDPPNDERIAWLQAGLDISARVDARLEFMADRPQIVEDTETAFSLCNRETGRSNFEIPEEPEGRVRDRDTGTDMGARRDVLDLGRWIVAVGEWLKAEPAPAMNRHQRRAKRSPTLRRTNRS